jgi:hypothetical protein
VRVIVKLLWRLKKWHMSDFMKKIKYKYLIQSCEVIKSKQKKIMQKTKIVQSLVVSYVAMAIGMGRSYSSRGGATKVWRLLRLMHTVCVYICFKFFYPSSTLITKTWTCELPDSTECSLVA